MEYEIKWWEDWIEGDMLDRLKMVEKLPFSSSVIRLATSGMDEKMIKSSIATYLNGFFEDLESAMYVKHDKEMEEMENGKDV